MLFDGTNVGKIVTNKWELDVNEVRELFSFLDVKFSLTMAYNLKINGIGRAWT